MKIAIVHDDLVQWGGAERVLEAMCEAYPDAPIYTSVFDKNNSDLSRVFAGKKIITSFLQQIPMWRTLYKVMLPFYPIAFEQFNFDSFDVVISHTTRFAKAIITKPQTKHICYCHTPPRFLWRFSGEKNYGLLEILLTKLRLYDSISSKRVDYFLAGSKNAQIRIKKIYRKDSKVVYPFVDLKRFADIESFDGGYYVVISRLNKYKKIDLVVKGSINLGVSLKVIGVGPELSRLQNMALGYNNIEFLGKVDDIRITQVLSGAKALIVAGTEDFGLVSLEAQALGKPVIALNSGGAKETIIEGKTGIFFNDQTIGDLSNAISKLESVKIDPDVCKENAKRFSKEVFVKTLKQEVAFLG